MAWAPAYLEIDELKAFLRISSGDTVDDAALSVAIEAASRAIDVSCNRQFGKVDVAEERFYTARWDRQRTRWVIDIDDLMDMTGLVVEIQDTDGNAVGEIDDYVLEPRNAAQRGRPWTALVVRPGSSVVPTGVQGEIAATGLWGWTALPGSITQGCQLQASRFHARRESPYGVAGSPDLGSELRLLAKLDPDVAVIVAPYRRWWAVR